MLSICNFIKIKVYINCRQSTPAAKTLKSSQNQYVPEDITYKPPVVIYPKTTSNYCSANMETIYSDTFSVLIKIFN